MVPWPMKITTHWESFLPQNRDRHGLVEFTYFGEKSWCSYCSTFCETTCFRAPGGNWTSPNGDPCLMYDVDFSKVQNWKSSHLDWVTKFLIVKVTSEDMIPLNAGSVPCTRWRCKKWIKRDPIRLSNLNHNFFFFWWDRNSFMVMIWIKVGVFDSDNPRIGGLSI